MVGSMNVNEKAAELLETAADGWESGQHQWIQGNYSAPVMGEDGLTELGYCSVGMLCYLADPSTLRTRPIYGKAREALRRQVGYQSIPFWNDHPLRTKGEVIDAFKNAAKNLRNEE